MAVNNVGFRLSWQPDIIYGRDACFCVTPVCVR